MATNTANSKERDFYIEDAINSLAPNANWLATDPIDPTTIQWFGTDITRPTDEAIIAEMKRLTEEWPNKYYQLERAKEYPEWETQLDYIYHNGIDRWKADVVDPVKAKYPKP